MSIDQTQMSLVLRRPLAGICVGVIFGLLVGFAFPDCIVVSMIASGVLLAISFIFAARAWSDASLLAGVALLAAAYGAMATGPAAADDMLRVMDRNWMSMELEGVVGDEAVTRDGESLEFPLRVEGVRKLKAWQRASGTVAVHLPLLEGGERPKYGQRWRLSGVVERRAPWGNEPMLAMRARREEALHVGSGPRSGFYEWCMERRKEASALLAAGMLERDFPRELGMMRALVLGERGQMDPALQKAFQRTGTLHVVAISGSHVAVFFALIVALLRGLGVARTGWAFFAAPVLVVYTTLAGLPASAVRSCVMAIVFMSAPVMRRRSDGWTALAVSAMAILAVAPRELCDPGFLLSFLVVAGLMLFYGPIFSLLKLNPPPELPGIEIPAAKKTSYLLAREVAALAAVTAAAWLVSEPLIAMFFNIRSPVALLANLLVVPLAFFILLSGCLSLSLGQVWTPAAEVFNHAGRVFSHAMLWVVEKASSLPGSFQFVKSPPLFWVIVFYVLLLMVFFSRGRRRIGAVAASFILMAWWCGDYFFNRRASAEWFATRDTAVLFLDLPRDRDVLVNTGDRRSTSQLQRFLQKRGVDRLHVLALTRPSAETLGGAMALLEEFPADEVWVSAWKGRSPVTDEFLAGCSKRGIAVRTMKRGDSADLAGGLSCMAMHPRANTKYRSAVAGGLALRFERGPASLLFTGGNGPDFERDITTQKRDIGAEILMAGTRPRDLWTPEFLDTVRPREIVMQLPLRMNDEEALLGIPPASIGAHLSPVRYDQIWRWDFPSDGLLQRLEFWRTESSNDWKGTITSLAR